MKHFVEQVVGPLGQPISGATVTVRAANATPGTGALATIYSTDNTGTTPISGSVVTTDTSGTFDFYAPDGRYDLVAAVTGFNKTVADIEIFDATEKNTGDSPLIVGAATISNSGVFTNTQMNDIVAVSVNGGSAQSEWQAEQGNVYLTEAISGTVIVPAGATVTQANGVAGFIQSNATAVNSVGIYGQARANATNTHLWGGNVVADDKSKASTTMTGFEIDANVGNTGTTGAALQINGAFTGSPGSFPAIQIAPPIGGGKWSQGLAVQPGSCSSSAIEIGPVASGNSQSSLSLFLDSKDAGGASRQVQFQSDLNGTLTITTPTGQSVRTANFEPTVLIKVPNGSAAAPSYTFGGDLLTGMYLSSLSTIGFGVAGGAAGRMDANGFRHVGSYDVGFFSDTYVNRQAANTVGIGTSGSGKDGFLQLGKITGYNGITTVSGGVPAVVAAVDLTAQTAAVGTTTTYAVPASGAGQYKLTWNAKVTTVAGVSSTLGALTVTYTDPDGVVQTITAMAQTSAGTSATTNTGNITTASLLGMPLLLNCKANTNIQHAFAYASNAANAMAYNLHLRLEWL